MSDYGKLMDSEKPAAPSNPYAAMMDQEDQVAQQRVRGVLDLASQANPDAAAQAVQLSRQSGLPVSTVESNLPDVARRQRIKDLDVANLMRESPVLAAQLQDPTFAKISHDDIQNLSSIEQRTGFGKIDGPAYQRNLNSLPDSTPQRNDRSFLGASTVAGLHDLYGAGAKLLDAVNPFTLSEQDAATLFKDDPGQLKNMRDNSAAMFLSRIGREQTAESQRTMNELSPASQEKYGDLKYATTDTSKAAYMSPVKVLGDAIRSLPTTAALAVTTLLTRGAASRAEAGALSSGATAEAAQQAGTQAAISMATRFGAASEGSIGYAQQALQTQNTVESKSQEELQKSPEYAQLVEQGYSPEAIRVYLAAKTGEQSGIGAGAVDAVTNMVGGRVLGKIIGEGGALVPRIAKGAANEAATEFVQSGGEQVSENLAMQNIDPQQKILDDVLENAMQGLFVGGLTGGAFAGMAGRERQHKAVEQQAQDMTGLFDLAAQSKVRERDPETFKQFFQSSADAKAGQPSTVFVSPQNLADALDKAGLGLDALPSAAVQMSDAIERGGEVEIPTGELVTALAGTGAEQSLIPHLRLDPNQPTLAETQEDQGKAAQLFHDEATRIMAEQQEKKGFAESAKQVETTILDQLNEANRFKPDVNQGYAALVRDFFVTTASKTGMTPMEMYQRYPLRITTGDTTAVNNTEPRVFNQSEAPTTSSIKDKSGTDLDVSVSRQTFGATVTQPNSVLIEVRDPATGNRHGFVDFAVRPDGVLVSENTKVAPNMRGKGIAEAMYQAARNAGYDIAPGRVQTDDGQALVERLQAKGVINKEAEGKRFRAGDIDLVPIDGQLHQSGKDVTDTPAFKKWFGDSKVVDADGKPLVVYHGTDKTFNKINMKKGAQGVFWVTSDKTAIESGEVGASGNGKIMELYAKIENPAGWKEYDQLSIGELIGRGYDGVVLPEKDGTFVAFVFDPNQIKSATGNNGNFDPSNPSILAQTNEQNRGGFNPETLELNLLAKADYTTFVHETGHFFLTAYADLAAQPNAPQSVVDDMNALLKWFGIQGGAGTRTIDIKNVLNKNTEGGFLKGDDAAKEIVDEVEAALAAGDKVTLYADGKPQPIVAINRGMMQDQKGQRWGTLSLLTDAEGKLGNKVEISSDTKSALEKWSAMSLDQQRPSHEKFAETFEQYLFTGKAPSVELQPLFRRVASWMKNVYKSLQSFAKTHPDAELNPEISAVFDRMLATDQEIALVESVRGYTAMFKTAEEGGMTVPEWNAYQDTNSEATADAQEQLNARALRDMKWLRNYRSKVIKNIQKEAATVRAETRKQIAAQVEAQPVYKAMQWLKRGEMTGPDGENIKVTAGNKLQISEVRALYPEGALVEPPNWKELGYGKYGMLAEEGLNPELAAEMFGYPSGDQLIHELLNAAPINEVIDQQTDQTMLEQHGDLTDIDAIEKAADEAVHNKLRAKSLATELHFLNKKLGSVQILMKAAKAYAQEIIGRKQIDDVKPNAFVAAESRAAKAAEKALKSGDTEQAIVHKRAQVLNNAAATEAMAVNREIDKTLQFFRKVAGTSKDSAKSRDYDMVQAAKAILAEYGIGTKGKQANEYLKNVEAGDPAMYTVLRDRVDAAVAGATDYRSMTVNDMRTLKDEIDSLWFLAKRSRQMEVDGDLLDRQEVQDDLYKRMEEIGIPDRIPGEGHAVTPAEKALSQLQSLGAAMRRMESWVGSKDGSNEMGPFRQYIWTPVKEAADRYRMDKVDYLKQYRDLLKGVAPTLKPVKINAPELGYVFGYARGGMGKVELLHAILHTGNESNLRKLLLGRNWGSENENGSLNTDKWDTFVNRMIKEGHLNKADFDFAQGVWDLLDKMKPLAQKTHRDVFGHYFEEVTANGFKNQFGSYRGGYVPAMADPNISADAKMRDLANQENETLAFAFPTTSKGFTKSRVEYNRPLMLDLRTLASHIDKVLLFSHLEQPVRDISKVMTSSQVSTALNRIDPAAYDGLLTPWLNRAAKQVVETTIPGSNGLMRFFSVAKSRAGMAAMFGNVANAAQQITGLSLAAVKVKPSHLLAASAQVILNPRDSAATVAAISPYMASRMQNEVEQMTGAINDILLNPSTYESAKNWTARHAYFLQSAVDNVVGPIVWLGAYNQALETAPAGMTDEQMKNYARRLGDSVVRETQGSTLPEDVSRLETGNAVVRMFTQFTGYFNMNANLLGTEFSKITRDMGLKKGAGRGLYVLTAGLLVPAIVGELIMQGFRGGPGDDDKDGEYLDDWMADLFGWAPLRYVTAMVPVVGTTINAFANHFNDKPYDDKISTAPAISMIESAITAPFTLYESIVNDKKPSAAVRDVATLISMTVGVPANAIARPLGYLADVNANKVEPTSAADAVRGTITGTASPESKR